MAKSNPTEFETAFDVYKTTSILGEGGSGRVFAVTDSVGGEFAIKALRPDVAGADKRKRFKNELGFCLRSVHDNILKVVGSGVVLWNGKPAPFYVMPRFSGTLRQDIEQGIAPERVLPIFDQVLSGIQAAHLAGVIHRDIKPENILRNKAASSFVVADFGIAHFEEDALLTAVETKVSDKLLNIAYSAPEQRRRGVTVDHRADIYSLGLMLNEMFTGHIPEGSGHRTVSAIAPSFGYLDALIDRMRQQIPAARPQSIEEVKKELIARGNDFVRLQRLDERRREVVPAYAPGIVEPVEISGATWTGQYVKLALDRQPSQEWIQHFQFPKSGISYQMGMGPETYQFSGAEVSVRAYGEGDAQTAINQFKQWSPVTTIATQAWLEAQARDREVRDKQELAKQIAEMERLQRVNSALRI